MGINGDRKGTFNRMGQTGQYYNRVPSFVPSKKAHDGTTDKPLYRLSHLSHPKKGGFSQNHPAIKKMLRLHHPKAQYWLNVARVHDLFTKKLQKCLQLAGMRQRAATYEQFRWAEERLKLARAEADGVEATLRKLPFSEFIKEGFCTQEEHDAWYEREVSP